MKLVHVVPHVNQEASGPSYSVPRLCEALAARGHDVELSCQAARQPIPGVRTSVYPEWRVLRRFAISPAHARALARAARHVDVIHNHSLWSMVNVAAGWVVPGRRAKLVTSPRGTLSEWAMTRNRRIKRVLSLAQDRALRRADVLHATSEAEYLDIRQRGYKPPVAVIPNGIDIPATVATGAGTSHRTLLYLGRIHPIKAVDRLLRAWRSLQDTHAAWRLRIVGSGEPEHVREIRDLAAELNLVRVEFAGALYGEDKHLAYVDSELFVLPSHSENFGMAVAEALAHGRAAVVGRGAPWAALESQHCGRWIANDPEPLAQALSELMSLAPDALATMGAHGRSWMARDFSWEAIAAHMSAVYHWSVHGGTVPDTVRLS